jgi:hypothetical protein
MPFKKSPVYCQGILVSKFLSLTPSLTDTEATYPYKTYMQLIIFYSYRLQVLENLILQLNNNVSLNVRMGNDKLYP